MSAENGSHGHARQPSEQQSTLMNYVFPMPEVDDAGYNAELHPTTSDLQHNRSGRQDSGSRHRVMLKPGLLPAPLKVGNETEPLPREATEGGNLLSLHSNSDSSPVSILRKSGVATGGECCVRRDRHPSISGELPESTTTAGPRGIRRPLQLNTAELGAQQEKQQEALRSWGTEAGRDSPAFGGPRTVQFADIPHLAESPEMSRATPSGALRGTSYADDEDDDEEEEETIPTEFFGEGPQPYEVVRKVDGVALNWGTQVLALFERSTRQYLRSYVSFIVEILSPLLFVVLIIILNLVFGQEEIDETFYVNPFALEFQVNSLDYTTYLCYGDDNSPIPGLQSCSGSVGAFGYSCAGDESGIPVTDLCFAAGLGTPTRVVAQYLHSMTGPVITIPTLDSIILHQWMAKKAGLAGDSRTLTALAALSNIGVGVSSSTRYEAITYSGQLFFAPAANVPASLLAYIRSVSQLFDSVYGGTFDTVEEAQSFFKGNNAGLLSINSTWGLIVLNDIENEFDVQIQLHSAALPTLRTILDVKYRGGFNYDGTDLYLASGFTTLQKTLYDYFMMQKSTESTANGDTQAAITLAVLPNSYALIASYPSIQTERNYLLTMAATLMSLILVLSFLYPFSQITKRLVLEKELRIRESMCIMGLQKSALWFHFYIVTLLELVFICILITVLLCAVVVKRSNPFIIFVILVVYTITLIPLAGLVSTFFSKARLASLLSPLIYFILSMPMFAMGTADRGGTIGVSILSPSGLAALLNGVFSYEAGSGFTTRTFRTPYLAAEPSILMIMLACDFVIYTLLMFYLDAVLPQEWGTRRHPLFFVIEPYKALCRCCGKKNYCCRDVDMDASSAAMSPCVPPSVLLGDSKEEKKRAGVVLDNLCKQYRRDGKRFDAVKDLSWTLYENNISVLLGPNGAGKSTTINLITGMLPPDSGDCYVNGFSISRQQAAARHAIGFCPQHNILWPDLTSREHLEFFAKIKGLRGAELEDAVCDILRAVDLEDKIDFTPSMLSGGQRRKLSVAIAFVGRSKVVLLDEPTAGMDPGARRHTWSLLRAMANRHSILLTTHFMDEADLLGDSIAIMNDGKMQCAGTSGQLRDYAGVGYTLRFDVRPISVMNSQTAQFEEHQRKLQQVWNKLEGVVHAHFPGCPCTLQTDMEVEYELPYNMQSGIPTMLRALEKEGNRALHIRGYALMAPTMNEVFMSVMEGKAVGQRGKDVPGEAKGSSVGAKTEKKASIPGTGPLPAIVTAKGVRKNSNQRNGGSPGIEGANNISASSPMLLRRMSRGSLRFLNNESAKNPLEAVTGAATGVREEELTTEERDTMQALAAFHSEICDSPDEEEDDNGDDDDPLGGDRGGNDGGEMANLTAFRKATVPHEGQWVNVQNKPNTQGQRRMSQHDPLSDDSTDISDTPTVTAAVARAHQSGQAANDRCKESRTDTEADEATIPNVVDGMGPSSGSEEDEKGDTNLFKNVVDRHLDLVWAAKHVTGGTALWNSQFKAMMYKRFFSALRDRLMQFFQIICPVFCILLAMLLQLVKGNNAGVLILSPNIYEASINVQLSQCPLSIPVGANGLVSRYTNTDGEGHRSTNDIQFTNPQYMDSLDMQDAVLDAWYVNGKYARYGSMQCQDSTMQGILQSLYPATVGQKNVMTLLYNTSSRHSLTAMAHTVYALAYWKVAHDQNPDAELPPFALSVKALPSSKITSRESNAMASILIGVIVLIPFTFLPANPVAWIVKERESRSRHLQTVSGLRYIVYWAGNLVFDFAAYVVTIILILCIFAMFQRSEYVGVNNIGATIVSFALYGLASCTAAYAISFAFNEHTTAQMVVLGVSFLSGFLCVMLVFVLSMLDKSVNTSNVLRWVFRIFPTFSVGEVILNLALLEQKQVQDPSLTAWSFDITVWPDIYMAAEVPLFIIFTLLWDHPHRRAVTEKMANAFRCTCCGKKANKSTEVEFTEKVVETAPTQERRGSGESKPGLAAATPAADPSSPKASQGGLRRRQSGGNSAAMSIDNSIDNRREGLEGSSVLFRAEDSVNNGSLAASVPNLPAILSVKSNDGNALPAPSPTARVRVHAPSEKSKMAHTHAEMAARPSILRRPSASRSGSTCVVTVQPPNAAATMMYRADDWTDADQLRRQEEDSDVEEERLAVYETEKGRQRRAQKKTKLSRSKRPSQAHSPTHEPEPSKADEDIDDACDVVRVVDLRKVYTHPNKVAVSSLNFSVMAGEVFAFLGTNGAGKSTTLSILTQEQLPTGGKAYVCGHDVVQNSSRAVASLGYCPQFDACSDLLNVEEHLRLYAMVRGVDEDQIPKLVESLLLVCNLTHYRSVLSRDLSGGNRRKLSVAMSLIGAPQVVCLDEPSSGMDPLARRLMWRALDRVSQKCSLLLTTHHLEEVEALADCVAIMVDGGLRCIGDLPHLKHKYARSAYELTLRVDPTKKTSSTPNNNNNTNNNNNGDNHASGNTATTPGGMRRMSSSYGGNDFFDTSDDVFRFMHRHFPAALLMDNFNNERYVYTIPATRDVAGAMQALQQLQRRRSSFSGGWSGALAGEMRSGGSMSLRGSGIVRLSEVFDTLREAEGRLGITEYSVSQVTLEQVFLRVCSADDAVKREENVRKRRASRGGEKSAAASASRAGPDVSQRRHSSMFLSSRRNSGFFLASVGEASPSVYRSTGGVSMTQNTLTFAKYRRQRARLRMRQLLKKNKCSADCQRETEPDHELTDEA